MDTSDRNRTFESEFRTIFLIEDSDVECRGIDAFSLGLIKTERQARKIFMFLIFQHPCFDDNDKDNLRNRLYKNDSLYFSGILHGINQLSPLSVKELIGDDYPILIDRIRETLKIRRKIFHGQTTNLNLTRTQLLDYVVDLKNWCGLLGRSAAREFGYSGFGNSLHKAQGMELHKRLNLNLSSINDFDTFLKQLEKIRSIT